MDVKAYDWVKNNIGTSHYDNGDRDVYVISRTPQPNVGRTIFYSKDLKNIIRKLKSESGKNIYCDGGAEIINSLLKEDIIDEMTISIVPILLGNGVRLFQDNRSEQNLEFISSKSFDMGLIQLHYKQKLSN